MTARPLRSAQPVRTGFRVVGGRSSRRPNVGPFVAFTIVVVASMLGIVLARTSLDAGAFELADIGHRIAEEQERSQLLQLEVAELSSPTRIGPMAEELGLVYPEERQVLFVEGLDDTPDLMVESDAGVAMGGQP